LRGSDLRGSDLRGSDLRGSDLRGSDLRGSDLRDSDLRGPDLFSLGFDQRGYHFLLYFEPNPVIRAGCRTFNIVDAERHWNSTHNDSPMLKAEILAKIEYAKAIIASRKGLK